MARRTRGSALPVVKWISRNLPWHFAFAAAVAIYVLLGEVAARMVLNAQSPGAQALGLGFKLVAGAVSSLFVAGGISSAIRQRKYGALLRSQQSIQGIRALSWQDFERLLAAYYEGQGYAVDRRGGAGADGGIDLVLRRGRERVLVQAKNWRTASVNVSVVREMRGLIAAHQATRGVVVSSGSFTKDAARFGSDHGVELVDGEKLAAMVRAVNGSDIAVQENACPVCGGEMVVRMNRRHRSEFLGCKRYPGCDGTRALPS